LSLTVNEATNTVLLRGPAKRLAKARELLVRLDVGRVPQSLPPPSLERYTVPGRQAESLARILQEISQADQVTKVAAVNASTIAVWATPEKQQEIEYCVRIVSRLVGHPSSFDG
jgi:hypothetical protein